YCDGRDSPEGAYERASGPQLAGLVINKIKTPSSSVEGHFRESYPQTDFATCIYLQEGREPASEALAALMIYGGIAAVVLGLGALGLTLFVWRKKSAEEARLKKSRKKGPLRGDEDDDEDDRPRKRRIASDDEDDDRPRKRRRDDDDEEDERPRKRRPVARED